MMSSLENHIARGALIVLCGEPGLGKTEALDAARAIGKRMGANSRKLSLASLKPESACERVTRECRALRRGLSDDDWAIVCVSGIPSLDERCVARMASAINRLRGMGGCIVLSLRPEAVQLIEGLSDAFVLWAHELCVDVPERLGAHAAQSVRQLSAGIPYLAKSLLISNIDARCEVRAGREYHDALCRLTKLSLRESLIDEERRLRLGMILLGSGSFVQLEHALGKLDFELMQDICRHAPLFGVDFASSSFSCAGLALDSWFASSALVLRDVCDKNSQLCEAVADILFREGRVARAGALLAMSRDSEEAASLIMRHSLELVNVGRVDLVRKALPLAMHYRSCTPQLRHACQTLLKLVDNARLDEKDIDFDFRDVGIKEERDEIIRIRLLLCGRLAWQGAKVKVPAEAASLGDALADDLTLHLSVTNALVEGRAHAAYHALVCGSQASENDTLARRLLDADLAFAHILMGLPCPQSVPGLVQPGIEGVCMLCYAPAFEGLDAVWRQGAAFFSGGDFDLRASQVGDELVRVHLLLASALAGARRGAMSHAAVKARRAIGIAKRLGARYLLDAARLVCWAIRINAGDQPSQEEFDANEPANAGLQTLAKLLASIASGADEPAPPHCEQAPDRDALWLAAGLLTGLNRLSPQLERVMPQSWLTLLKNLREHEEDESASYLSLAEHEAESALPEHSVYVQLLGGMEIYVNGERLAPRAFGRRRASSLVAYACSMPGRSIRRADIIDDIWPECDYEQGNKRIYAATHVINQALKGADPKCRFFAPRETDHTVTLDEMCVRSDVREFEDLAHRIINSEGDDAEVLSLVRSVESLYEGDLYTPPLDAIGTIERRRVELRKLYADVLVTGAEAAMRSGSLRLSVHLCEQALLTDDLREDANACLVKALYACGRANEARERARVFSERIGSRGKNKGKI